ncbi:MAG: type II toxin-antitoxin system RelE/ParE family toxin [Pirellulaceae bacterium]|nr:type II toxin-antitoxin system RelE/ParE family toxin [Pirellulaceae bacterium]
MLRQIDDAFKLPSRTPDLGFTLDHIKPGIRCKPVKRNYLVFYKVIDGDVYVLRVLHGARKYEDLL